MKSLPLELVIRVAVSKFLGLCHVVATAVQTKKKNMMILFKNVSIEKLKYQYFSILD